MSQNLTYYIIIALFIINVSTSSLRLIHFLQLKEYRFDRFSTFLRYEQGLRKLSNLLGLCSGIIALAALLTSHKLTFAIALLFSLASNLYIFFSKGFYRPIKTAKSSLITILTFSLVFLSVLSNPTITRLNLTFLFTPILILAITTLFYPITYLSKEFYIHRATQKIKKYPSLKIIGITGSYGKSSTKEFLFQILNQHFQTVKTPKNINTEIGVAKFILSQNFDQKQIFIVEMGAYQKGEIRKICNMTPPDISILTAIHNQHLSLYGTQENIAKTKLEIINHAKSSAAFIYNNDTPGSHYIDNLLIPFPQNTTTITTKDNLKNVTQKSDQLSFVYKDINYQATITGPHFAHNLSLAIQAAQELGLSPNQIQQYLKKVHLPENTFSIKKGIQNSVILDDSYNSSPQGFQAAISTASLLDHTGIKILITRGMLELGQDEEKEHLKVAQQANQTFDLIITTAFTTHRYFQSQVQDSKLKYISDPTQLIGVLKENMTDNDLILLENRVSSQIKSYLIPTK